MKLSDVLKQRRAVREFLPDTVETAVLSELIETACQAPSHMNTQPWSFVVIDEPARIAALGTEITAHLRAHTKPDANHEVFSADFAPFYHAPALVVVCATQDGALADLDCALAAYNLMLAAHGAGLGSCWVSLVQPWLASAAGRKALHLSPDERPIAPIVIGAPAGDPLSPGRFHPRVRWLTK